jgi:hypothetical protein
MVETGLAAVVLANYISGYHPQGILSNAVRIVRSFISEDRSWSDRRWIDFLRADRSWFDKFMQIPSTSPDTSYCGLFAWLLPRTVRVFLESARAIFREAGQLLRMAARHRERAWFFIEMCALETFLEIKRAPMTVALAFLAGDRLDYLMKRLGKMPPQNACIAMKVIACCYNLDIREHETLSRAAASAFKIEPLLELLASEDTKCQNAALKVLSAIFRYDQDLIEPAVLQHNLGDIILEMLPSALSRVKGSLLQVTDAIMHFAPASVRLEMFLTPDLVDVLRDSLRTSPRIGTSAKNILLTLMHITSLHPDAPEEVMQDLEAALADADDNPEFPGYLAARRKQHPD